MTAAARVYQGPIGRTRKGQAFTPHPSEQIFIEAEGEPAAYEVDLLPGLKPRLRVQIIDVGTSVRSEAGAAENLPRFQEAFADFTKRPEVTISKRPKPGPEQFRVAVLSLDGSPRIERIEFRAKPGTAWRDTFPADMGERRHPRMSMDAFGRLRFRTTRLGEIPSLLERAFEAGSIPSGMENLLPGEYQVRIRSPYETAKVHRAVAKTLVNYMVDQLGREWTAHPNFRPVLDYCIGRVETSPTGPFVGLLDRASGHPTIDSAPMERHALALLSDGRQVVGSIKTYGHFLYRVHLGEAPSGSAPFVRAVWIDFGGPARVPVGS
jgi:hypothetical protein